MPAQLAPAQNRQPRRQPQEEPGFLDKLFGGESSDQKGFNPQDYPAVYSAAGVVTGDTLTLNGRYFRLYGIDAPESNQTCADAVGRSYSCGRQAAAWLSSWLQDNTLECRVMQQDAKGNMVGTCLWELTISAPLWLMPAGPWLIPNIPTFMFLIRFRLRKMAADCGRANFICLGIGESFRLANQILRLSKPNPNAKELS